MADSSPSSSSSLESGSWSGSGTSEGEEEKRPVCHVCKDANEDFEYCGRCSQLVCQGCVWECGNCSETSCVSCFDDTETGLGVTYCQELRCDRMSCVCCRPSVDCCYANVCAEHVFGCDGCPDMVCSDHMRTCDRCAGVFCTMVCSNIKMNTDGTEAGMNCNECLEECAICFKDLYHDLANDDDPSNVGSACDDCDRQFCIDCESQCQCQAQSNSNNQNGR